ncbi:MAG TPA: nicotinate-nucleotide adenylyltransferase [Candidatus Dormibacteraeota bacterium]|jgi:nicotinate-nucleotide adenylyltransferase
MRIGVVGGTFDPIHLGHLAVAQAALECGRLDRVLLVPSARPPHRRPAEATAEDRLAMTRLAAEALDRIEVSDAELRREGPSYTVDTLGELRAEHPDAELFLVLGWDAARDIRLWERPRRVFELARVLVVNRPGLAPPTEAELRAAGLDPERVLLCDQRTPDVKATRVRAVLASGGELDGLLVPAVARYISEHGLYRGTDRE